jgi:hypothetical protein
MAWGGLDMARRDVGGLAQRGGNGVLGARSRGGGPLDPPRLASPALDEGSEIERTRSLRRSAGRRLLRSSLEENILSNSGGDRLTPQPLCLVHGEIGADYN